MWKFSFNRLAMPQHRHPPVSTFSISVSEKNISCSIGFSACGGAAKQPYSKPQQRDPRGAFSSIGNCILSKKKECHMMYYPHHAAFSPALSTKFSFLLFFFNVSQSLFQGHFLLISQRRICLSPVNILNIKIASLSAVNRIDHKSRVGIIQHRQSKA